MNDLYPIESAMNGTNPFTGQGGFLVLRFFYFYVHFPRVYREVLLLLVLLLERWAAKLAFRWLHHSLCLPLVNSSLLSKW